MARFLTDGGDLLAGADGRWLASVADGRIALRDGASGEELAGRVVAGPTDLAFTGGGARLLATTRAGGVTAVEGFALPDLEPIGRRDLDGEWRILAAVGERCLLGVSGVSGVSDGEGHQLVLLAPRALTVDAPALRGPLRFAAPAPEDRLLVDARQQLELWDVVARRALFRLTLPLPPQPRQAGFAHRGRILWVLDAGGRLEVYRFSDGRRQLQLELGAAVAAVDGRVDAPRLLVATGRGGGVVDVSVIDLQGGARQVVAETERAVAACLLDGGAAPRVALLDEEGRVHLIEVAGPAVASARPVRRAATEEGGRGGRAIDGGRGEPEMEPPAAVESAPDARAGAWRSRLRGASASTVTTVAEEGEEREEREERQEREEREGDESEARARAEETVEPDEAAAPPPMDRLARLRRVTGTQPRGRDREGAAGGLPPPPIERLRGGAARSSEPGTSPLERFRRADALVPLPPTGTAARRTGDDTRRPATAERDAGDERERAGARDPRPVAGAPPRSAPLSPTASLRSRLERLRGAASGDGSGGGTGPAPSGDTRPIADSRTRARHAGADAARGAGSSDDDAGAGAGARPGHGADARPMGATNVAGDRASPGRAAGREGDADPRGREAGEQSAEAKHRAGDELHVASDAAATRGRPVRDGDDEGSRATTRGVDRGGWRELDGDDAEARAASGRGRGGDGERGPRAATGGVARAGRRELDGDDAEARAASGRGGDDERGSRAASGDASSPYGDLDVPGWRGGLVRWAARALEDPPAVVDDPPLDAASTIALVVRRFELPPAAVRALALLYGARLLGDDALAPVTIARVAGGGDDGWAEALGHGALGDGGLVVRRRARLALRRRFAALLDGAAPRVPMYRPAGAGAVVAPPPLTRPHRGRLTDGTVAAALAHATAERLGCRVALVDLRALPDATGGARDRRLRAGLLESRLYDALALVALDDAATAALQPLPPRLAAAAALIVVDGVGDLPAELAALPPLDAAE